jgi:hypothetical protein
MDVATSIGCVRSIREACCPSPCSGAYVLAVVSFGVFAALFSVQLGSAQTFEQEVAPFPVRDTGGTAYEKPFLGGFDTPRPQFVDLDGDGDQDLFVQEQNGRLAYFEHTDSGEGLSFEWRTDHFRGLDVGAWARFGDLDGDGDPDLLAEEPIGNVRYYRNEGTATAIASAPTGRTDRRWRASTVRDRPTCSSDD